VAVLFPTNSLITNGIAKLKKETVLRIEVEFCLNNGHKKWHGTQLIALEVLEYRATISEPTPWDVSIILIFSLQKFPVF
jgi:hypothetical protein